MIDSHFAWIAHRTFDVFKDWLFNTWNVDLTRIVVLVRDCSPKRADEELVAFTDDKIMGSLCPVGTWNLGKLQMQPERSVLLIQKAIQRQK